jgi:2'-hydroxyisoflavone reductase
MTNRREFLTQTAVAASGLVSMAESQAPGAAERDSASAATPKSTAVASRPLRILILGGTGFIGPHFVRAAVERGHYVSVFNRGKDKADLPPRIERLIGDRNGDLQSISNRDWDSVFDLAAYIPIWVRTLGQALNGRVRHYTYISSEAVYRYPGARDEQSSVAEYTGATDPYSKAPDSQYGPLKLLCEREAEKQFPRKTLILRPGAIVGSGDSVGAFAYWLVRMERGGEILVAGDPLSQVQLIDARDLAEWAVRMAENADTGAFNAIGPAMALGWGEMLGGIRGTLSVPLKLTWVPVSWITEQKIDSNSNLLYWPSEAGLPGLMSLSNEKALSKGLTFRPLAITATDTLAWYNAQPSDSRGRWLMGFNGPKGMKDTGTEEDSRSREQELLVAWHARQKKIS